MEVKINLVKDGWVQMPTTIKKGSMHIRGNGNVRIATSAIMPALSVIGQPFSDYKKSKSFEVLDDNTLWIKSDSDNMVLVIEPGFILGISGSGGGNSIPLVVVDNLTSTDSANPLSANMGRVLNEDIIFIKDNTYNKTEVDQLLVSAMEYKGSVPTFADLPTNAGIGDVYNVEGEGQMYAFDGTEWNSLGMVVDVYGLIPITDKATQDDFDNGTIGKLVDSKQVYDALKYVFKGDKTALNQTLTAWNRAVKKSGFYIGNSLSDAPVTTGWCWGMSTGHTSENGFGLDIVISYDTGELFYRKTASDGTGTWIKIATMGDIQLLTDEVNGLKSAIIDFNYREERFFGEAGTLESQGWIKDEVGTGAFINHVSDVVDGIPQMVYEIDDKSGSGLSHIIKELDQDDWANINLYGASFGGESKLVSTDGFSYFYAQLANDTAGRRYGIGFTNHTNADGTVSMKAQVGSNDYVFDGLDGRQLIGLEEWFTWEIKIPVGLTLGRLYVRGVDTGFDVEYASATVLTRDEVQIYSGSTSGAHRVSRHTNFGVTIMEEPLTKNIDDVSINGSNDLIMYTPPGLFDVTFVVDSAISGRDKGASIQLFMRNVGATITLQGHTGFLIDGIASSVLPVYKNTSIKIRNLFNNANNYVSETDYGSEMMLQATIENLINEDVEINQKIDELTLNQDDFVQKTGNANLELNGITKIGRDFYNLAGYSAGNNNTGWVLLKTTVPFGANKIIRLDIESNGMYGLGYSASNTLIVTHYAIGGNISALTNTFISSHTVTEENHTFHVMDIEGMYGYAFKTGYFGHMYVNSKSNLNNNLGMVMSNVTGWTIEAKTDEEIATLFASDAKNRSQTFNQVKPPVATFALDEVQFPPIVEE